MIRVNWQGNSCREEGGLIFFFPLRALYMLEGKEITHKYGPEVMWYGLWAIEI